jgi:hypothetical protein
MEIITKKLVELNPAIYNPRQITNEALAGLSASITEFGCVEPIIWNRRTGNICGGHQRLKVLQSQGLSETEVVVVDLPLEREKALNIALNNRHIQGDWTRTLGELLKEIEATTPELYADLNLEALVADIPELEIELPEDATELDEVPELVEEPVIKSGDLVRLGRHYLLCGDSTNAEDVTRLMSCIKGGQPTLGSVTLCLTDPPYCVNYENIKRRADEPWSDIKECILKEPEYEFGDVVQVKLKAYDAGSKLKGKGSQKIWKNKTCSQIAKEIIRRY